MTDAGEAYDIGPLGDEAAKLFGALAGWAREHTSEVSDLDGHMATTSAECTVCPICRVVHAARQLTPEVKAHLASAATSLAQAAAAFVRLPDPADEDHIEHVDLDE